MKLHPVVGSLVLSLLSLPLSADCGCADSAPCEELSIQEAAARDPESSGFGLEMAPVATQHAPIRMAIEINSASSHGDAAFGVLILFCAPFVPIISVLRRLMSSTGPLIELKLPRSAPSEADALTCEDDGLVRGVTWDGAPGHRCLVPLLVRTR